MHYKSTSGGQAYKSFANYQSLSSPQKYLVRVPLQRLPVGLTDRISGHPDALAMEGHIGLAVVEVVLEPTAN